jgi:RimJ/RimL family protein N-acetyltransferase
VDLVSVVGAGVDTMAGVIVLETARLRLRPLTISDVDLWVALHADERVNRFVGSYTRQGALDRLEWIERQWSTRGHGVFAIEAKESGEFLGRGGLHYWEQFDEVEAGWTLRAEAWGHGYAAEAARAFLDWGFDTLDAPYFTAMISPGNTASARVAERLGFTARREDTLFDEPVTVYGLDRPVGLEADA